MSGAVPDPVKARVAEQEAQRRQLFKEMMDRSNLMMKVTNGDPRAMAGWAIGDFLANWIARNQLRDDYGEKGKNGEVNKDKTSAETARFAVENGVNNGYQNPDGTYNIGYTPDNGYNPQPPQGLYFSSGDPALDYQAAQNMNGALPYTPQAPQVPQTETPQVSQPAADTGYAPIPGEQPQQYFPMPGAESKDDGDSQSFGIGDILGPGLKLLGKLRGKEGTQNPMNDLTLYALGNKAGNFDFLNQNPYSRFF